MLSSDEEEQISLDAHPLDVAVGNVARALIPPRPDSPRHLIQVEIIETGRKFRFYVQESDTIAELKFKMHWQTGIPTKDMQIFRPQQCRFRDDQTLRELNLLELSENLFLVHTGK